MAILRRNSAEGGSNTTAVTTGNSGSNSGDAWTQVIGGTNVWTFSTDQAAAGSLSYKIVQATTTAANVMWDFTLGSVTEYWGRMYMYYTAYPPNGGGATTLFRSFIGSGFTEAYRFDITPTGAIRTRDASLAIIDESSAGIIVANTWMRYEWHVKSGTGTSGQLEIKVFSGDSTTAAYTYTNNACNTGTATDHIQYGPDLSSTTLPTCYMDELVIDDAVYPGPANLTAFDAVYPGNTGTTSSSSPLTWSHTALGTNRAVVVCISQTNNGLNTGEVTATYGGVSMTALGFRASGDRTSGGVWLFGLANPPLGSQTVSVQRSAGSYGFIGGSISFSGVDQTTPFAHVVTGAGDNGSGTVPISTTITSATGNMVVDVACYGNTITSSNQTQRWLRNVNTTTAANNAAGSTAAGASSVTMSYTTSQNDWWGMVVADVKAAPAQNVVSTAVVAWLGV